MADATPGPLAPDRYDAVKARAQKILNHRGEPPYTVATFENHLLAEEVLIIGEFVQFWRPFIVLDGIG